jgi:hypothetical protein
MQMFMCAMYAWAFVLFNLSKLVGSALLLFMKAVPEEWTPRAIPLKTPMPVRILRAGAIPTGAPKKSHDVTNKINLFTNINWSELESKTNVDFNQLASTMDWAVLWVCYMCEIDKNEKLQGQVQNVSIIIIDFVDKIIQRADEQDVNIRSERTVFGRYTF